MSDGPHGTAHARLSGASVHASRNLEGGSIPLRLLEMIHSAKEEPASEANVSKRPHDVVEGNVTVKPADHVGELGGKEETARTTGRVLDSGWPLDLNTLDLNVVDLTVDELNEEVTGRPAASEEIDLGNTFETCQKESAAFDLKKLFPTDVVVAVGKSGQSEEKGPASSDKHLTSYKHLRLDEHLRSHEPSVSVSGSGSGKVVGSDASPVVKIDALERRGSWGRVDGVKNGAPTNGAPPPVGARPSSPLTNERVALAASVRSGSDRPDGSDPMASGEQQQKGA